jgi:hypothetical protein
MGPALAGLDIADDPASWEALGFALGPDGAAWLGGVAVRPVGGRAGEGIVAARFDGLPPGADLDGLPLAAPPGGVAAAGRARLAAHPNGARAVDHVVVATPALGRTLRALETAGLAVRRVRDVPSPPAPEPLRQAFLLAGPCVLEVAGRPDGEADGPAAFWGVTVVVDDLDALAERLGDRVSPPRAAVQPGRRIATLRRGAGSSARVAFMTPRPAA